MSNEDPILDEVSSILGKSEEENRIFHLTLPPSAIFDISGLVGAYNIQQQSLARRRKQPFTGEGISSLLLTKLSNVRMGQGEGSPVDLTQREIVYVKSVFDAFIERTDPDVPRLGAAVIERYRESRDSFLSAVEQAGGPQTPPPQT